MKEIIGRIFTFFRDDFFPHLSYYLLQVFLVVLLVIVFAGINIFVRFVTDPLCIKVLRMREDRRGPGFVGLFFSTIIMALLLIYSYAHFPQMRPTVVGWVGGKLQQAVVRDELPDLIAPAADSPAAKPADEPAPAAKAAGKNAPAGAAPLDRTAKKAQPPPGL